MNQHFIYNTLNHVLYFIHKGERDAALTCVIKLSRLLRQWMPEAGQSALSIPVEADLLHTYLTLQQMRFPGRFSFDIMTDVPEGETVFINPHIIFPLTEHAVGWCLKQPEESHICIRIEADAPFIRCSVEAEAGKLSLSANVHLVPQSTNTNRLCNVSS